MLGHRGCRLGITYPELTKMQAKAIVLEAAQEVLGKEGSGVDFLIGTMIEVPHGAVTADEIAKEVSRA